MIKVTQPTMRAWLSLSPPMWTCTWTVHVLYPFTPNKHFICFTTFCLSVEIHFCTADETGSCHWLLVPGDLMAMIQHSYRMT